MAAAAALLRAAVPEGDRIVIDGEPVTAEQVRDAMRAACAAARRARAADVIVACVWQGFGHESGQRPAAREPADPDRPLAARRGDQLLGRHDPDVRRRRARRRDARAQDALVRQAHFDAPATRSAPASPAASCTRITCDIFEAAGHRTQRTGPGEDPNEGFQFSLGHGVGLEVHEDPGMGQTGRAPLVPGDVLAIEPGLWEPPLGGLGSEDLLLVTEDGREILTDYPYDLTP